MKGGGAGKQEERRSEIRRGKGKGFTLGNTQEGWEKETLIAATQLLMPCNPRGCMPCLSPRTSLPAKAADKIPAADSSGSRRK